MRYLWPLLLLVGCTGEAPAPYAAEYCVLDSNGTDHMRLAAYWVGVGELELAADRPLHNEPDFVKCLQVPPPKHPERLDRNDAADVLLFGYEERPWVRMQTYAPLLITYDDTNQDQQFTPPGPDGVVIDHLISIAGASNLRWIFDYETTLQTLRDGRTNTLFNSQPEPGVPFISTYLHFVDFPPFEELRATRYYDDYAFGAGADPWCQAEKNLHQCGRDVPTYPQDIYGGIEISHAPTLPPAALISEYYVDPQFYEIDRLSPAEGERIYQADPVHCWVADGVAIATKTIITALNRESIGVSDCRCFILVRDLAAAAPIDALPKWWPCAAPTNLGVDPQLSLLEAREVAERIGLRLPPQGETQLTP
jgi:hypothetical protein